MENTNTIEKKQSNWANTVRYIIACGIILGITIPSGLFIYNQKINYINQGYAATESNIKAEAEFFDKQGKTTNFVESEDISEEEFNQVRRGIVLIESQGKSFSLDGTGIILSVDEQNQIMKIGTVYHVVDNNKLQEKGDQIEGFRITRPGVDQFALYEKWHKDKENPQIEIIEVPEADDKIAILTLPLNPRRSKYFKKEDQLKLANKASTTSKVPTFTYGFSYASRDTDGNRMGRYEKIGTDSQPNSQLSPIVLTISESASGQPRLEKTNGKWEVTDLLSSVIFKNGENHVTTVPLPPELSKNQ